MMPRYPNGYIPASELVLIEGNHPATRGTAARWAALKADVLRNEGVTLRITGGENAYRSYAGQVFARKNACARGRCNDAAVPGTSSHGGSLNGRDSGAIDVDNWALLGKEKFYAYARRNGFEPGHFSWEPWHIIDWNPYTVPSTAGGGTAPSPTPLPVEPERNDDMSFAMRVDGDASRGPVEIVPGFRPLLLSQEEFDNYYGGKAIVCNARQYDVNKMRNERLMLARGSAFLGKGTSSDRPWTLFSPGYVFKYAGQELLDNQPFTGISIQGNDRQYDLWTAQALSGQMSTFPVKDVTVDTAAIVKGVLAGLPEGSLTKADVASAVADELSKLTLVTKK